MVWNCSQFFSAGTISVVILTVDSISSHSILPTSTKLIGENEAQVFQYKSKNIELEKKEKIKARALRIF